MFSNAGRHPRALDILLRHGAQRSVSFSLLFCMALALLFCSFPATALALDRGDPVIPVLYNLQVVFGFVLPFCCAWDSRLLEGVRKSRFLESILLSAMTPEEWSDGLVLHGMAFLLRFALPLYGLGLLVGLYVGQGLAYMVLWLPVAACLMVAVSYVHQVRMGHPLVQGLSVLGLVVVSSGLAWSWTTFDATSTVMYLCVTVGLLLVIRRVILAQLARLTTSQEVVKNLARATKPFSKNPIVMRESWRAARRGGVLLMYVKRLWPTAALILVNETCACDRAEFFFPFFGIYALVAMWLSYQSTAVSAQEERGRGIAVLLQTTGLTAREYCSGWLQWAMRYRYLEAVALSGLLFQDALRCSWPSQAWWISCWVLGILALCWFMACVRLLAACRGGGWLSQHLYSLLWFIPSALLCISPIVYVQLVFPWGYPLALFCGAPLLLSVLCLALARRAVCRCIQDESGGLRIPD